MLESKTAVDMAYSPLGIRIVIGRPSTLGEVSWARAETMPPASEDSTTMTAVGGGGEGKGGTDGEGMLGDGGGIGGGMAGGGREGIGG